MSTRPPALSICTSISFFSSNWLMNCRGSYGVQMEKKTDDEMGELVDSINDMSMKIDQAERTQSEFISSVSQSWPMWVRTRFSLMAAATSGLWAEAPDMSIMEDMSTRPPALSICTVLDPVIRVTETAKRIAAGSYGVQMEKKTDDETPSPSWRTPAAPPPCG